MDDETVKISESDEAKSSVSRLLKAIENWASKESQKSEIELTGFAAALFHKSFHSRDSLKRASDFAAVFSVRFPKSSNTSKRNIKSLILKLIRCTSSLHRRWKNWT